MRLRSEGSNMNEHAHVSMVVFNNSKLVGFQKSEIQFIHILHVWF